MAKQRESSEIVKERILKVARELFAGHGIKDVSIRKIAAEAGINHALVIRYFGSKSMIVNEILRREISSITGMPLSNHKLNTIERLIFIRRALLSALDSQSSTMKLIMRAGLDGLHPESFVEQGSERAADKLASWMGSQQTGEQVPDAKLTSLVITGALFSLSSISPWLMTSVGLPPEDYARRREDIIDVIIWILVQAVGLPPSTVDLLRNSGNIDSKI